MPRRPTRMHQRTIALTAAILLTLFALSLGLAWLSNAYQSLDGWTSYLVALLLGAGLLWGGWLALRKEHFPRSLVMLVAFAALLRLAAGALWYSALPAWGYASPAELRGYVMADAYDRDRAAFELAQSGKPLWKAYQGSYHRADQYGGMLYLSAGLYRYAGGSLHQPLLVVVITAAFSALGVLFLWAFARRAWEESVAWLAAWALALFPEAVLLGSSQMREAFIITLFIVAFYGLVRYWRDRSWSGPAWILAALLLCMPLSPPAAGLLMASLAILGIFLHDDLLQVRFTRSRWLWVGLGVLALLIIAGIGLAWGQITPEGMSNPLDVIRWWVKKSAEWQAHLSERASGKIQAIFDRTPDWLHLPMLIVYGVVQPLLPAALVDVTSTIIWRLINIWRAVGWTALLALLLYAPLLAWKRVGERRVARALTVIVWLVILIASYRSGGDMWDNPRYRAMLVGLQIALAAWTWIEYRRTADAGLRRLLVGICLILVWFLPWYLMRYVYLPWPVTDEIKVLGLGIASAALYWIWDWAGSDKKEVGEG